MTSSFLSTTIIPRINLQLLRRDYFDGFSLLLQDEDGVPFDLSDVTVCASAWNITDTGSLSQLVSINVEKQEPLDAGRIRLWLTSAQTATLWDAATTARATSQSFFPSIYSTEVGVADSSNLIWDVRIEKQEYLADLVSISTGTFVSQTNHTLASSERVIFKDTLQSTINYNGTSARVYSGLTNISYEAPYTFRVPTLSGVTSAAPGGSVYRLRQDTVVAGAITVGTTLSNCFP